MAGQASDTQRANKGTPNNKLRVSAKMCEHGGEVDDNSVRPMQSITAPTKRINCHNATSVDEANVGRPREARGVRNTIPIGQSVRCRSWMRIRRNAIGEGDGAMERFRCLANAIDGGLDQNARIERGRGGHATKKTGNDIRTQQIAQLDRVLSRSDGSRC